MNKNQLNELNNELNELNNLFKGVNRELNNIIMKRKLRQVRQKLITKKYNARSNRIN